MKFIVLLLSTLSLVNAFGSFGSKKAAPTSTPPLPTFDAKTQTWSPAPNAEEPYGIGRTLLGNGPVPTFTRLTNPDDYMQAVYKFQATQKCTVRYAQGNMDAYFENPNDWAYQRQVEERGGYKKKYGEPIPLKQVVLTVVWGLGVSTLIANWAVTFGTGKFCLVESSSATQFCKVFFPDIN
mmetsp:Transcript_22571/g.53282  ORF Transcript_22571/g.53282 Transcript_22571/m.53282 type:complete len:181 (-) Transcript_22571:88-630(-)